MKGGGGRPPPPPSPQTGEAVGLNRGLSPPLQEAPLRVRSGLAP